MEKCNFNQCKLQAIEDDDKCILHCKKNESSKGFQIGLLNLFFNELIRYIQNNVFQFTDNYSSYINIELGNYLYGTPNSNIKKVLEFMQNKIVIFNDISFPEKDSSGKFDYVHIIEKIGAVQFNNCEFHASDLDLKNTKLFFKDCTFNKNWFLDNHKILDTANHVLYQACNFKQDIVAAVENYDTFEIENSVFCDCCFGGNITLENIKIKGFLFKDIENKEFNIELINIVGCTFDNKFLLNNKSIVDFKCVNTVFNDKAEFKQNTVNSFEMDNTNFRKLFDCYQTSFKKFSIKKSIFDDFVGFENCIFGNPEDIGNKNYIAQFMYATFLSFINFRYARFLCGLDLVHINLIEPPNFLNIDIFPNNTPRETFRIIKYSFDKIGNYIEANKFFEYEMRKYKEELKNPKKRSDKFLLQIYEITSIYGQSYLRPILFTLITSLVYWLLLLGYENNILYYIFGYENNLLYLNYPYFNGTIKCIFTFLNGIARNILPFSKVLKEGMEFISLIFYILFTTFIWLTILAIKRKTKR